MEKGCIHIYTGNGKGKTTAAFGLAMRAYGNGFRVLITQFLKNSFSGEVKAMEIFKPLIGIYRIEMPKKFIREMNADEKEDTRVKVNKQFEDVVDTIKTENYDMLIMDELLATINYGLIPLAKVQDFLMKRPKNLEIVITGRNAPNEIIEIADYVSEINEIKHPYKSGIKARKGIEF